MRYVSFFSGIEMASLAFEPLGWEPVAFAEVDPFACAALAHHYPGVPNLGDVSKITADEVVELGRIDLFVMGFPCQDVSQAGLRKGLRNEDGTPTRTGLFFDAMRLVRAAHRRCGTRWLIGENVPGLYSSNAGRDFATVVGEIVGSTFDVPGEGWQDSGAAAGPRGMVEWSCLDAQWRGVAQRRERVFFVADFGAWADRSPVLLERESLSGDPPACVAARQRPAVRASRGAGRKSIWRQIAEAVWGGQEIGPTVAGALNASDGRNGADDNDAQAGRLSPEVVPPLLAHHNRTGGHRQPGMDVDTCESLVPLAYGGNDTSGPRDVAACLNAKGGASRMDFESETFIATPRSGGVFDDVAHTLRGDGFDASEDGTGRGTPLVAVDVDAEPIPLRASGASGASGANGAGIGRAGDPMLTLDTSGDAAIAFSCKDDGRDATEDLAPTMRSMNFDKSHANAGGQLAIAFHARQDPDSNPHVTHPLDTDGTSIGIAFDTTQTTRSENRCNPQPGDPCHPLSATAHPPAYATRYEVRRLTPLEAERLMGVREGYTDIPYRGKDHAPDGPRYKALGNGFAVPVMRWIGERIDQANVRTISLASAPAP